VEQAVVDELAARVSSGEDGTGRRTPLRTAEIGDAVAARLT
jgi:hypothetical protein